MSPGSSDLESMRLCLGCQAGGSGQSWRGACRLSCPKGMGFPIREDLTAIGIGPEGKPHTPSNPRIREILIEVSHHSRHPIYIPPEGTKHPAND